MTLVLQKITAVFLVSVSLLGFSCLADVINDEYVNQISSQSGQNLNIRIVDDGASDDEVFTELEMLEMTVAGGTSLPAGALVHVACTRPECAAP